MLKNDTPTQNYRRTWANYYVKFEEKKTNSRFFQAYKDNSIDFWGLTVQNEAGASQRWQVNCFHNNIFQSMTFTPQQEGEFVANYLGPTLKSNDLTKDLILMVYDWDRDKLPAWTKTAI